MKFLKLIFTELIKHLGDVIGSGKDIFQEVNSSRLLQPIITGLRELEDDEEYTQAVELIFKELTIYGPIPANKYGRYDQTVLAAIKNVYRHITDTILSRPKLPVSMRNRIMEAFIAHNDLDTYRFDNANESTIIPTILVEDFLRVRPDLYDWYINNTWTNGYSVPMLMQVARHNPNFVDTLSVQDDDRNKMIVIKPNDVCEQCSRLTDVKSFVDVLYMLFSYKQCYVISDTALYQWQLLPRWNPNQDVAQVNWLINIILHEVNAITTERSQGKNTHELVFMTAPELRYSAQKKDIGINSIFDWLFAAVRAMRPPHNSLGRWSTEAYNKVTLPAVKVDPRTFLQGMHFRTRAGSVEEINKVIKQLISGIQSNRECNDGVYTYSNSDRVWNILMLFLCVNVGKERIQGTRNLEVRQLAQHVATTHLFHIIL